MTVAKGRRLIKGKKFENNFPVCREVLRKCRKITIFKNPGRAGYSPQNPLKCSLKGILRDILG